MLVMKRYFIFSLLICFLASNAFAQTVIEVLPLKHRSVEEVVPLVSALIGGQGKVVGMNRKLIVRTTRENLRAIRELLKKIDFPLRNLLITVKQDLRSDAEAHDRALEVEGRIGDHGTVRAGPDLKDAGGSQVGVQSGRGEVRAHAYSGSRQEEDRISQRVLVLEGQRAVIQLTHHIPFKEVDTVETPGMKIVKKTLVFRQVTTGFQVIPRLSGEGDRVTLEVAPLHSDYDGYRIESHGIFTTVSGRLGDWIELGSMFQKDNLQGREVLGVFDFNSREKRSIFLKVEILP